MARESLRIGVHVETLDHKQGIIIDVPFHDHALVFTHQGEARFERRQDLKELVLR